MLPQVKVISDDYIINIYKKYKPQYKLDLTLPFGQSSFKNINSAYSKKIFLARETGKATAPPLITFNNKTFDFNQLNDIFPIIEDEIFMRHRTMVLIIDKDIEMVHVELLKQQLATSGYISIAYMVTDDNSKSYFKSYDRAYIGRKLPFAHPRGLPKPSKAIADSSTIGNLVKIELPGDGTTKVEGALVQMRNLPETLARLYLKNPKGTLFWMDISENASYGNYIFVQNCLDRFISNIREKKSHKNYGLTVQELPSAKKYGLLRRYPLKIHETYY